MPQEFVNESEDACEDLLRIDKKIHVRKYLDVLDLLQAGILRQHSDLLPRDLQVGLILVGTLARFVIDDDDTARTFEIAGGCFQISAGVLDVVQDVVDKDHVK